MLKNVFDRRIRDTTTTSYTTTMFSYPDPTQSCALN